MLDIGKLIHVRKYVYLQLSFSSMLDIGKLIQKHSRGGCRSMFYLNVGYNR